MPEWLKVRSRVQMDGHVRFAALCCAFRTEEVDVVHPSGEQVLIHTLSVQTSQFATVPFTCPGFTSTKSELRFAPKKAAGTFLCVDVKYHNR